MKKREPHFWRLFFIGGIAYGLIEIIWRGYTHWSMILTGGLCFSALYRILRRIASCPMKLKCIVGSCVITYAEFISGFIFNHCMKLGVWDYSSMRFNLCGQICPLYSFLWGLLTIPVAGICRIPRRRRAVRN